jgi:sigma-B regulation protein RsbU (phosphoserine phosphatase)
MEPAREVGGDLYDFFVTEDGKLCFLVGDVSGKGMPAALFMARAKSLIRLAADLMRSPDGKTASPSDIITRVNRELCLDNSDMMFVTLFLAILTPETGEVEYCNAGHNPPYQLKGSSIEPIEGGKGMILGVSPDAVYPTGQLKLAPGEGIYLFTDGVTEANNAAEELYGEHRLEEVLRGVAGAPSAEIIKTVTAEVGGFVGQALPFDDITMLSMRRLDRSGL